MFLGRNFYQVFCGYLQHLTAAKMAAALLYSLLFEAISADTNIIQPTITNTSGEYYINPTGIQYETNEIICGYLNECYVECTTFQQCESMIINASQANQLSLVCKQGGCRRMNIIAGPTYQINVACTGIYSVFSLNIYIIYFVLLRFFSNYALFRTLR